MSTAATMLQNKNMMTEWTLERDSEIQDAMFSEGQFGKNNALYTGLTYKCTHHW